MKSCEFILAFIFIVCLAVPVPSIAKEAVQTWELIMPQGKEKIEPIKMNLHPSTLEGKTVVLRWNGKPNGENFLNRVAELLTKQVKDIKIIKMWETDPATAQISHSQEVSKEIAAKIAKLKPSLVIASQCD